MQGVLRAGELTSAAAPTGEAGDAELVALAQADSRSFELLYRRYVNPVHRYCSRRLGSREAAEDATSVVFTKAFASLAKYRDGSFRSWLFTIAHHVVADDLRSRRPTSELEAAGNVADREPSPEEIAVAADAQRVVTALLARLPEGQRRVIELRLAGLSGREIAAVLGRGLPAVKIAQLRGYTLLRALLAAEFEEGAAMPGFDMMRAERLSRYLDGRSDANATRVARRVDAPDPALVHTIDRLDALDDAPDADPAFANRLLEDLMATTAQPDALLRSTATGAVSRNGRFPRGVLPVAAPGRERSRSRAVLAQLATAALVVLTLIGSFFAFGPGRRAGQEARPAIVPAISGTPGTPPALEVPIAEFVWETSGGPGAAFEGTWLPINVAPDGNLWVLDGPRHQFQIFAPDGTWLENWGTPGSGPGEFDFMVEQDPLPAAGDIAFDEVGNLYVVDSGNYRVQKFAPDRSFIAAWGGQGREDGQFLYPGGVVRDANGLLYLSDGSRADVQVFDGDGRHVRTIGGRGREDGQFEVPGSTALDADGDLWLVDFGRNRIQEFSPDGELLRAWGEGGEPGDLVFGPGELHGLGDIAIDDQNRIFVPDRVGERIQIFSPSGEYLASWGGAGSDPGKFTLVNAVALDGNGFAYVSEFGSKRIQKFRLLPPFGPSASSVLAAAPQLVRAPVELVSEVKGHLGAPLNEPSNVGIDPSGNVWITEGRESRFAIFTPDGSFLETWGS